MPGILNPSFIFNLFFKTISHINSETNPPSPIINVVCKYLDSSMTQAMVLIIFQYAATLSSEKGSDLFLQSEPLVSKIYVRY